MPRQDIEASAGYLDDNPIVGLLLFLMMFAFCTCGLVAFGRRSPVAFLVALSLLLILSAVMIARYVKLFHEDRDEYRGPNI